ncbi:GNAT family N-acetyltransferase [Herpetosiphon geysericola]|uniref:N-acetyltransferase domain-containing protein n=1 Tax=Herpetosiphon geysericola TaxID=70996 RepID=A0A0P6Z279_9CHLR|nr:GNAT family N-acetyltransferase [Herpetosiphon geysericola]KPL91293.1 hypothetical protein SE18_02375 [Herpetosiphon geysericola]
MATIRLEPITEENFRPVLKLKVRDDQTQFVAQNMFSVAEAYVHPDWEPRAIYADTDLVGFVLMGRDSDTGHDWIIRFMIGAEHQGKGYSKPALLAVIDHLKHKSYRSEIRLSYVPGNAVAEKLYQKVGFEATGEVEDGEIVMRLVEA